MPTPRKKPATDKPKAPRKPAAKKAVRILIVDDHPLVRRGIRDLRRPARQIGRPGRFHGIGIELHQHAQHAIGPAEAVL